MIWLKRISLFPYFNWWRLGGRENIKSYFGGVGGVVTLLILLAVGTIFVYKLVDVLNQRKISVR